MTTRYPLPSAKLGEAEEAREPAAAVVTVDDRGVITSVDARFERVFGWERAQIIGKPVTLIIPERLRDAHQLGFSRFLLTHVPTLLDRPLVLRALTKSGREFAAEHVISAELTHGRWSFCARIRPRAGEQAEGEDGA